MYFRSEFIPLMLPLLIAPIFSTPLPTFLEESSILPAYIGARGTYAVTNHNLEHKSRTIPPESIVSGLQGNRLINGERKEIEEKNAKLTPVKPVKPAVEPAKPVNPGKQRGQKRDSITGVSKPKFPNLQSLTTCAGTIENCGGGSSILQNGIRPLGSKKPVNFGIPRPVNVIG